MESQKDREGYLVMDGSKLEGGGQFLRNSVSLCCLTKTPLAVENIRMKRSTPGLRPQHLHGLRLVRDCCSGKLIGDEKESTKIQFRGNNVIGGTYEADTKTAGSVCLLLQISLPCFCFADKPSTLVLKGGTDAEMAPPIDYYMKIFHPLVSKFGVQFECTLVRRGFYPQGRGEVKTVVHPVTGFQPVSMVEFGSLKRIHGTALVAGNLPVKVAEKMASSAVNHIKNTLGISATIDAYKEDRQKAFGTGCSIIIIAETSTGCLLGGCAVGKKGKPAEEVGYEAANMLCEDLLTKPCVDRYMQDQLIIFMALASGTSKIKVGDITMHTKTAIYIAETITKAKFTVEKEGNCNLITCTGIGFTNDGG